MCCQEVEVVEFMGLKDKLVRQTTPLLFRIVSQPGGVVSRHPDLPIVRKSTLGPLCRVCLTNARDNRRSLELPGNPDGDRAWLKEPVTIPACLREH